MVEMGMGLVYLAFVASRLDVAAVVSCGDVGVRFLVDWLNSYGLGL